MLHVLVIDGDGFDSRQFLPICEAVQSPFWRMSGPYIKDSLRETGIPGNVIDKYWSRLLNDLTNYKWISFFHCPKINCPPWTDKILKTFRHCVPSYKGN
jgi:hypothetical protein